VTFVLRRSRAARPPTGPVIAGYAGFELIGAGGFSKVYTARQEAFARTVAVKIITVTLDDAARRRFARERALTGQLDGHPHIVRVYDTGETDAGEPYLAMEHHQQGSLADRVRRQGPLPVDEVLRTGVLLADALAAAHARGIVHRDVKPQNVLVSSFVGPVLADFGIAAVDSARHTTVGHEAFSVQHAAPEVLAGEPATYRSDLYSLASTLYELLAGRAPFADDDKPGLLALLHRVQNDPLPPMGRDDVPPAVEQGLAALLARDPADRPADAAAFAERLQILEGRDGRAPTPRPGAPRAGDGAPAPAGPSPWARPPAADVTTPPDRHQTRPAPPAPGPGPVRPVPAAPGTLRLHRERRIPPAPARPSAPAPLPPPAAAHPGPDPAGTVSLPWRDRAPDAPVTPEVPTTSGRRRRIVIGVAAATVVSAVAAGAIAALTIRSGDRDVSVTDTPAATPTATAPPATGAGAGVTLPPCLPSAVDLAPARFAKGRPPTDLRVEVHADGRAASVRWTDPNGGASAYAVFQRCAAGDGRTVAAVATIGPGTAPVAIVDALRLDTNYCFTVGVLEPTGGSVLFTDPVDNSQFRCLDGGRQ
jgi:serine/threonine-protein kinase PknK